MKSITRNRLYNSINASRIEIDNNNIDNSIKQINKQLSLSCNQKKIEAVENPTIYHMESLYRDNSNDKYNFKNLY